MASADRTAAGPRRGLSRVEAATYVGISPSFFDRLVAERKVAPGAMLGSRRLWDVRDLDRFLDGLFETVNAPAGDDVWSRVAP